MSKSNEEIFGIIDYLNSLSFSEFELETSDIKIRIKRENSKAANIISSSQEVTQETPAIITNEQEAKKPSVLAPITGVYYQAAAPGEEPFVKVGDMVHKGDTLCILEAMKNMIEVTSDMDGQIEKILGQDGDSIDEGQVLFIFKGE
ncbi:MAG: acetyl-CoA carboxylase biotin carboxyl carrier protein subunit [Eubacteriales bacterium]